MATSFFGGEFFGGEFFSAPSGSAATAYKGGRGDNKAAGDAKQSRAAGVYKPTGLAPKRRTLTVKGKSPEVQRRLDETQEIAAEIAGQMARELGEGRAAEQARAAQVLTERQVAAEIARLLGKKIRTEDDEVLLLLLMAAAIA